MAKTKKGRKRRHSTSWQTKVMKLLVQSPQEVSILGVLLALVLALLLVDGTLTGFLIREGGQLVNQTGFWIIESGPGYEADAFVSNVAGSELHYRVVGTNISLLTQRRDDYGILEVFVDGKAQLLDLYSPEPQYNVTVLLATDLSDTEHSVIFRVTGGRNTNSRASFVVVDEVFSRELLDVPSIPQQTQSATPLPSIPPSESLSPINETGVWVMINDTTYINGTAKLSNTNTSSLLYTFYGPYVTIASKQRDDFGIMDVLLDGVHYSFDLWNETESSYNMTLKTTSDEWHKLVISVSGQKNSESFGTYVFVDEIIVSYEFRDMFAVEYNEPKNITHQLPAEINHPVIWVKTVVTDGPLAVEIPAAENITVKAVVGEEKIEIMDYDVLVKRGTSTYTLETYADAVPVQAALTGASILGDKENITVFVDDNTQNYEITYETAPPLVTEKNITPTQKEITLSSDLHYENITTYTTISESPQAAINLYHLVNGSKVLFTGDITYIDENENGLIDKLRWVVPHLSNQTFIIEITVLNVFAYPRSGENWTVFFNTTGTANLTVTPVNDTLWDREISFVELKCGEERVDASYNRVAVFQENYACNETATFTSFIHIAGKAALEFRFGDAVAYAYDPNQVGINVSWVNITPDTVRIGMAVAGMWNYTHTNRTVQNGTVWTWFINGTEAWRDAGLVGYWRFDVNYSDLSNRANNAGQNNSAAQPANVTGLIKGAVSFDGVDDQINASYATKLDLQNMTIAAWIKYGNFSNTPMLLSKFISGNPANDFNYNYKWSWQANGSLTFAIGSGTQSNLVSTPILQIGRWYHVVSTVNGTQVRMYVDGALVTSATQNMVPAASTDPLVIGFFSPYSASASNVTLDELRIYNRSLSSTEIANLYNMMDYGQIDTSDTNGWTPAQDKPISLWHFDELIVAGASSDPNAEDAFGLNVLSTGGATAGLFGKGGVYGTTAVNFTGTRIKQDAQRNVSLPGNISIEVWVNPGTLDNGRILSVGTSSAKDYELYLANNGSAVFQIDNATTMFDFTKKIEVFSRDIPNGTFTHLMATYNGSDLLIYRNGTLEGRTLAFGGIRQTSGSDLLISVGADTNNENKLNATLDELAIYNRALTAEEVNQSFLRGYPLFGLPNTTYGINTNLTFRVEPSDGVDFGPALDSRFVTVANILDGAPPFWSNNVTNFTRADRDDNVLFNVTWNDSMGLSGYIFATNNSAFGGTSDPLNGMFNDSWVAFSGSPVTAVVSVARTINTTVQKRGSVFSWRVYANDTSNNWNNTGTLAFIVSNALPVASDVNITPANLSINSDAGAGWNFSDTDKDTENGSVWTWIVNGTEVWRDAGLVGYWRFDVNYSDLSNRANNAGQNNSAAQPANVTGLIKGAVSFDGVDDQINASYATKLDLQNMTIAAWVKYGNFSNTPMLLSKFISGNPANDFNYNYKWSWQANGSLTFAIGSGSTSNLVSTPILQIGRWYHVVSTVNGTQVRMYVDGALVKSATQNMVPAASTDPLVIGFFSPYSASASNVTLDELRIYNRSLSSTEIANLYTMMDYGQGDKAQDARGTPAPSIPVLLWNFNDNHTLLAKDMFGKADLNGLHGVTANGVYGTFGATFDGTQNMTDTRNVANLTGNFTVETWMSIGTLENGRIFSSGQAGTTDSELYVSTNGSLVFSFVNVSGFSALTIYSRMVPNNTLFHFALTYNETHVSIYRNGTLEGRLFAPETIRQSGDGGTFRLGADVNGANFFNGTLDEFAIYKYALTEEEVNQSFFRNYPLFGLDNISYNRDSNVTFAIEPSDGRDFGLIVTAFVNRSGGTAGAADTSAPGWSANVTNITTIRAGDNVLFNVTWTDDTGLSTYIFSINDSGAFINDTARAFSGTTAVGGVGKTINTTRKRGDVVGWRFYANDTSNNWNSTSLFTFLVANTLPNVTLVNITPYSLTSSMDVAGTWNYSDREGDGENGSVWTWIVNGTEVWRDAGLVGYWRFDVNYSDLSNRANNAGQNNSAAQPANVTGLIKGAVSFDGVDDQINASYATKLDLQNMTIAAWVKYGNFSNTPMLLSKFISGNPANDFNYNYKWSWQANGSLTFAIGSGSTSNLVSTPILQIGRWYHVVSTVNGTQVRMYVDGRLTDSVTESITPATGTDPLVIGFFLPYSTSASNVTLDELRIYNRSLSSTEIANLYNMMDYGQLEKASDTGLGTPAPDKPVSLWHFNDSSQSVVKDAFGRNDVNGTLGFTSSGQYGTQAATFTLGNQTIGNNGLRNLALGNITVEAWINPNALGSGRILSVGLANNSDYELFLAANGSAAFRIHNTTTTMDVYSRVVANGTFTHIVATYNGSDLLIYRNGTQEGRTVAYGSINAAPAPLLRIGANTSSALFYNGTLDELAVYDRALTIDEVNQSFLRNFPLFGLDNSTYSGNSNLTFRIEPSDGREFGMTVDSEQRTVVAVAVPDTSTPSWSNNATNFTVISEGENGLFNVTWTDDTGLSGYIFSINDSGLFVNQSFTRFSGTTNVSSVGYTINSTIKSGQRVGWRFYANDTSNNWNVSNIFSFSVTGQEPGWSNNATNFTVISEGENGLFNMTWKDNVGLSGYIFSINDSGLFVNQSFTRFSGTTNVSSVGYTINNTIKGGQRIGWRFYANDTSNNWNVSNIFSFSVTGQEPGWSTNVTNFTSIRAGENGMFNVTWKDNVGLSGYIFSINDSGLFVNDTVVLFSGTTNVSSVGKTINSTRARGDKIGWRVYANDTSDNWNSSSIFTFLVGNTLPTASLVNFTPYNLTTKTDAAGTWNYSDVESDAENGSVWTWIVNSTEVWRDTELVGYWRFDANMSDSSNFGHHGSFDRSATAGTTTSREPNNATGIIKGAYKFLGANTTINVSSPYKNESIDNIWDNGGTLAFWMKMDNIGGTDGSLIHKDNSTHGWQLTQESSGDSSKTNLSFTHRYSTTNGVWTMDSAEIKEDVWTHVAMIYNNSVSTNNVTFYVNGRQVVTIRTTASSGNPLNDSASNVFFGGDRSASIFFNGSLDEIRFYNRTLTTDEIFQLYTMMDYGALEKAGDTGLGTPAPDKPVSLWHFNENSGSIVKDAFGRNDVNGTLGFTSSGQYGTPAGTFTLGNQTIGNNGLRNLALGNITVEAWINPNALGSGRILSVGLANNSDYELFLAANGSAAFRIHNTTTTMDVYSRVVANGTFTHIMATYNGSDLLIYRNGTQEGRTLAYGSINAAPAPLLRIGANTSSALFYNGTLDELAVYDRALTIDEVNQSFLRNYPLFGLDTSVYGANSNITFRIEPNDGREFSLTTNSQQMIVSDATAPSGSTNATNFTTIRAGENGMFNLTWIDNIGLSSYIFSINDSGLFVNNSAVKFSGTTNVSSVGKTINSTRARGDKIGWRFYANDTSNNWGSSSIFTFLVGNTVPTASLVNITPSSPTTGADAAGTWNYSDAETDAENGSVWTWIVNGTEVWRDTELVGYWRFDANISDSSNFGHHGSFDRSAPAGSGTTSREPNNATGIIKGAYKFLGANTTINVSSPYTNESIDNIWDNGGTLAFWMKMDNIGGTDGSLIHKDNSTHGWQLTQESKSSGDFSKTNLSFTHRYSTNNGVWVMEPEEIKRGTWTHIAMIYNSSLTNTTSPNPLNNVTFYVNGRQVVTIRTTAPSGNPLNDSAGNVFFGGDQPATNIFNGSLDEIRFYNRTLTTDEIFQLYTMMDYGALEKAGDTGLGTPAPDKPVSLWHFNENSGSIVKDAFGRNDVNGTLGFTSSGQYGTPAGTFTLGNQTIGNNGLRNLALGNITVEAWINPNALGSGRILSVGLANNSDYELFLAANGSAAFRIHNTTTTMDVYSRVVANGTFTHIVVTYNGTDMVMYRNGTQEGRTLAYGSINAAPAPLLRIGANTSSALFYNGTLDELAVYDRALTIDEVNQSFLRNYPLFGLDNTTYNANSNLTFRIEPSDGRDFGTTQDSLLRTVSTGNTAPSAPALTSPLQNETTRSRNPVFRWNASTDADGNTLFYHIQVANLSVFNETSIHFNVSNLSAPLNFSNDTNLIPTDVVYFWRVRAFDGTVFGDFSSTFNFTIESFNSLSLVINSVNFGLMSNNDTNDTSDNAPYPFLVQNDGNVLVDITINGSSFWRTSANPTRFYQFKIRENETNSYTLATATANYTNMPTTSTAKDIPNFDFRNTTDTAYIDMNITVPSGETAGKRNSTITLTSEPI